MYRCVEHCYVKILTALYSGFPAIAVEYGVEMKPPL
jgi:hypothetical protein